MSEQRAEQLRGLQAFVEKFFAIRLSSEESLDLLNLLDSGHFASADIPRLIQQLRLRQ